ncbi:hypothetical protein CJ030_MR7G021994 [Morella rubra]|uniref:Uncharacterized protein n=1 Tax=Morella rubra TaxID=262757 RepID=A0A6A1UZG3_9ROSI|nr:hypothetical protein CJ030_MR7G021994 [Morella rubra]
MNSTDSATSPRARCRPQSPVRQFEVEGVGIGQRNITDAKEEEDDDEEEEERGPSWATSGTYPFLGLKMSELGRGRRGEESERGKRACREKEGEEKKKGLA